MWLSTTGRLCERDRCIGAGLFYFGTYVTMVALWQRAQFGAPAPTPKPSVDELLAEKRVQYGMHLQAYLDGVEYRAQTLYLNDSTPRHDAFYYPTIIDYPAPKALARPGVGAKPPCCTYCNGDGYREGYTEVLNDERGSVVAWDSAPCDCPCHGEPYGD